MTEKGKENPQKTLSKEMLSQALLKLMKQKPYNKITISEITECAQLSRRTFYRHYVVIDDIMDSIMDDLCTQYISLLLKQEKHDLRTLAFVYFEFWKTYEDFLLLLVKNELLFLLLQKYNQYFNKIRTKIFGDDNNSTILEHAFYFNAGGFWNLHLKLLKEGTVLSPSEITSLVDEILKHSDSLAH